MSIAAARTAMEDSPLPPVTAADGDILNESQWQTLLAVVDAVIPRIEVSTHLSRTALTVSQAEYDSTLAQVRASADPSAPAGAAEEYLAESGSSSALLRPLLHRMICDYVRKTERDGVAMVLTTLGTRAGSLVLTGSPTPFHLQPVNFRAQTLLNWTNSYLPPLRAAGKQLSILGKAMWIKTSAAFPKVIGFPRVPVHGNAGDGHSFSFIQIPPGEGPEELETDVVVVGSGCGAGVAAKNLAEAGHRVIVAEKAYHFAPKHLPMTEMDGGIHLFENGGNNFSDDSSTLILTGSAWGGGGTINWSASLQTQEYVRKEWAEKDKLPFFTSADFQTSLDRVCERMGASADHIEHNKTNQVLLEGGRKLGYTVKPVPQNTGGTKHYCGYCTYGCGSCEKQGPAVSYLPDAERAGALFMEGIEVEKVLFKKNNKGEQEAVGVAGTWVSRDRNGGVNGPFSERTRRRVIIHAKRVVVSCGSMQSPLLLLRSGLKSPHIGRHLHLHPCNFLAAAFDEPVRPWEGGILTAVVSSLENLDAAGHGPKLEALTMMPAIFLPAIPWLGGPHFKALAASFNRMTAFISLVRERDTGRVYPDPHDGKVRVEYTPSSHTRQLALEGVLALAKIAYTAGARRLFTATQYVPDFVREDVAPGAVEDPGINDARFRDWLTLVRRRGLTTPETTFGSAHQMGSCRMSARARDGVVDPRGQVWGCPGLYVMDASVFPSASGVNPMVTNMAISDWTSRRLAQDLAEESGGPGVRARL